MTGGIMRIRGGLHLAFRNALIIGILLGFIDLAIIMNKRYLMQKQAIFMENELNVVHEKARVIIAENEKSIDESSNKTDSDQK